MSGFKYASPAQFYPLAGKLIPVFLVLATILLVIGLTIGLYIAPIDVTQKDSYRIIFIHVPAAWMSMFLYVMMAFWYAVALGANTRLSAMMGQAIVPTGALMTVLALWTGSFWGKPTWGTYWEWDARMTSELVLLFLYLGVIALRNAIDDPRRADKACGVLAIVGVVNVPIIYFSVQWWNTLHQGATISVGQKSIDSMMLTGLLVMVFAFWFYAIVITLMRLRAVILEREAGANWVSRLSEVKEEWR